MIKSAPEYFATCAPAHASPAAAGTSQASIFRKELSDELWIATATHLPPDDLLLRFGCVNRRLRAIAYDAQTLRGASIIAPAIPALDTDELERVVNAQALTLDRIKTGREELVGRRVKVTVVTPARWGGPGSWIRDLVVSTDGRFLGIRDPDHLHKVWDLAQPHNAALTIPCLNHAASVLRATRYAGRPAWLVAYIDGWIEVRAPHNPEIRRIGFQAVDCLDETSLNVSATGKFIFVRNRTLTVQARVLDMSSGQPVKAAAAWPNDMRACAFSPNERETLTLSADGRTAHIRSLETGASRVLDTALKPLIDCVYSPSGRYIGLLSADGEARIYDAKHAWRMHAHCKVDADADVVAGPQNRLHFSGDEQHVLIVRQEVEGGPPGFTCEVWDLVGDAESKLRVSVDTRAHAAKCFMFAPDMRTVIGIVDGRMQSWNFGPQGQTGWKLAPYVDKVARLACVPNGPCIAIGFENGTVRLERTLPDGGGD